MTRPQIEPALLAQLSERAPARLVRKLDANPRLAEAWDWTLEEEGAQIETPRGERVSLGGSRLTSLDDLGCTCLLAPRCLHVLAVASLLGLVSPEDDGTQGSAAEAERGQAGGDAGSVLVSAGGDREGLEGTSADSELSGVVARAKPGALEGSPAAAALSHEQRVLAEAAWQTGGELLQGGGLAAGALIQAELLRLVHGSRIHGLHRLAAAGLRLVRALRDLRGAAPGAGARALPQALTAWLETAWGLRTNERPGDALIGVARRRYAGAGRLDLCGVLSEALVSATGAAGVVTLFVERGRAGRERATRARWFSLANVRPGEPSRAEAAYLGPVGIADVSTSHREVARGGLQITRATASPEGRLGSGQAVRAVSRGGALWSETLRGAFAEPLAAQVARAKASLGLPREERRAGSDLVFGTGLVLGREGPALWLSAGLTSCVRTLPALRGAARSPSRAEQNHALLARAGGLALAWIGRLEVPGEIPTLRLLAVGPPPCKSAQEGEGEPPTEAEELAGERASSGEVSESDRREDEGGPAPGWAIPDEWGGRVNLAFDALESRHLGRLHARPQEVSPDASPESPLEGFERRLDRLALGGPATLSGGAGRALKVEARQLRRALLPTAAELLGHLAAATCGHQRDLSGHLAPPRPEALAHAYLGARVYLAAAEDRLSR